MKIITLNIWGGHVYKPLLEFIKSYSSVDIFCLQEVYHKAPNKISSDDKLVALDVFSELQHLLPEHIGYFRPVVNNIYGIGMFVKKTIDILEEGEVIIHDNPNYKGSGPTHSRNLQWLECRINHQIYSIFNMHGLWNGMGKTDTPDRIIQSQRIKDFMNTINTPKILCGDFNLTLNTQSMSIIESGMINLIKTHNISSTRTSLYQKEERLADYILISPEIKLNKFEVLKDEVSDHSPLYLDFI